MEQFYVIAISTELGTRSFLDFLNRHSVTIEKIWRVFIENSTKPNHPLNVELLHKVLLNMSISHRDYFWTTYINELASEEERLFQLVDLFDKGKTLDGLNEDDIWLLLILFS